MSRGPMVLLTRQFVCILIYSPHSISNEKDPVGSAFLSTLAVLLQYIVLIRTLYAPIRAES